MKIEMGKTYKTAGGLPVRVVCTDYKGVLDEPVLALVLMAGRDCAMVFSIEGEAANGDPLYNLVETSMWDGVAVDAKVFVKNDKNEIKWTPRHFAKYENGFVYAWIDGKTSHVTDFSVPFNFAATA